MSLRWTTRSSREKVIDQTLLQTKRKNDVPCSSFSSWYLSFSACNWAEINLEHLIPAVSAPVEDIFYDHISFIAVTWDQAQFERFSYILSMPTGMLFTKRNENKAWSSPLSLWLSIQSSSDWNAISPSSSASSINSAQSSSSQSVVLRIFFLYLCYWAAQL